jgi:flagellar hook-associated protein 2
MVTSTTTSATDSAATGSALVLALGSGTGIDMTALATNLANAQFAARLGQIDKNTAKLESKISLASSLKSDLLALATSLGDRVRTGDLAAKPSVANASVASASLPLGSTGTTGSYSLEVQNLAAPQVLKSPSYASGSALIGSGSLTIDFGSISGGIFTADAGHTPLTVNLASGATLNDAARAINAARAGVSAYVANDSTGSRLVLKGPLGDDNGFTLSATEASGDPGLANLAWEPVAGDPLRRAANAANAHYKLDGIDRSSASNSIDNAAPGVSLKLTGTNLGNPTTISFSDPASAIASAMQDLTSALNGLRGSLNTDTNALTGDLNADSGAKAMARKLSTFPLTTIMPNAVSGAPKTLSDLGLGIQKDGTYALDSARLATAIQANPSAVTAMFTNGIYGIFASFDNLARNLTSASDPGSLAGSIKRYTAQKTTLTDDRSKLADSQSALRSQLIDRFAKTNSAVAASKSTLEQLKSQVAYWTKSGN